MAKKVGNRKHKPPKMAATVALRMEVRQQIAGRSVIPALNQMQFDELHQLAQEWPGLTVFFRGNTQAMSVSEFRDEWALAHWRRCQEEAEVSQRWMGYTDTEPVTIEPPRYGWH